jgi:opacity protein-like surface antigen
VTAQQHKRQICGKFGDRGISARLLDNQRQVVHRGVDMTKRLTSLLATSTFIIAASGSAFAADIAVKAPLPAPVPVYSWTGWYVGGNVGAGFGHATTDFNAAPVAVTAASDIQYPSGFTGGGQIGYNWQYSPLIVVGLEADFQGAAESDCSNLSQPFHLGAVTGSARCVAASVMCGGIGSC